jgi:peptide/nickel transport system substrate-binding protein
LTALAAGLAGCSSDGDGGDGGGDGDTTTTTTTEDASNDSDGGNDSADGGSGSQVLDKAFVGNTFTAPKNYQWNPYGQNFPGYPSNVVYDVLAKYVPPNNEFVPVLATDWAVDGKTFSLTVAEGRTWHDGSAVTAEDVATRLKLDYHLQFPLSNFATGITAADERTVEVGLEKGFNPQVLYHTVLPIRLTTPHSEFGGKVEALESASTESEKESARQDVLQHTIPEPLGNGPFRLENQGTNRATFTRYPEYPTAGDINFERVEFSWLPSNQKVWAGVKSGNLDGQGAFMPPKVRQEMPEHFQMTPVPAHGGMGVAVQHSHPHLGKRAVRQALQHVLDTKSVTENVDPLLKTPIDLVSGLPPAQNDRWLSDVRDSFVGYDSADRATALLEGAGYTKQNGTWTDESGDPLEFTFTAPAPYSDWVTAAQATTSQWKQFGVAVTFTTAEASAWVTDLEEGNFEAASAWWGSNPYAYFNLDRILTGQTMHEARNYPTAAKVPPVGEPDGERRTVNVDERVTALSRAPDREAAKPIVEELAWVVNQTLPVLPVQSKASSYFVTTDEWEFPPLDSPAMNTPVPAYWPLRLGEMRAKTE